MFFNRERPEMNDFEEEIKMVVKKKKKKYQYF